MKYRRALTHEQLVTRAERWLLYKRRCGFVLTELKSVNISGEIPDCIGWKYSRSHLIECKATRGDFLQDRKKRFRVLSEQGMGALRWYMTPPDLVTVNELPERWGLLYVYPTQVREIRAPELFRNTYRIDMPILCSALRRVHLRGDLAKIYDPSLIET